MSPFFYFIVSISLLSIFSPFLREEDKAISRHPTPPHQKEGQRKHKKERGGRLCPKKGESEGKGEGRR